MRGMVSASKLFPASLPSSHELGILKGARLGEGSLEGLNTRLNVRLKRETCNECDLFMLAL